MQVSPSGCWQAQDLVNHITSKPLAELNSVRPSTYPSTVITRPWPSQFIERKPRESRHRHTYFKTCSSILARERTSIWGRHEADRIGNRNPACCTHDANRGIQSLLCTVQSLRRSPPERRVINETGIFTGYYHGSLLPVLVLHVNWG